MSGRLENLQKTALKIIYGFSRSYQSLLEISGLETLNQRRKKAVQKFASKTLQNHYFGNVWFEENNTRSLRHTEKYTIRKSKRDRLRKGTLNEM